MDNQLNSKKYDSLMNQVSEAMTAAKKDGLDPRFVVLAAGEVIWEFSREVGRHEFKNEPHQYYGPDALKPRVNTEIIGSAATDLIKAQESKKGKKNS